MDLHSCISVDDLFNRICSQLELGYCESPFYNDKLNEQTLQNLEPLIRLNKLHFWSIDSQTTNCTNKKQQRGYLCGFMKRDVVNKFAEELSAVGKFVGIYDHIDPDNTKLFIDKVCDTWLTSDDFTVEYKIGFNDYGNPVIKPYKHIYDYGSEIDELKGYFDDKQLERYILENYVEVAIIEPDFKCQDVQLFELCANILEKL